MKEPGYIYILVNPSMDGFVKIGKTTREPEARAKELSQATGVATPFYVAYSIRVADCQSAEEYVYTVLEYNGFQRTPNREFFRIPLRKAIEVLMLVEQQLQKDTDSSEASGQESASLGAGEIEAKFGSEEQHPGRPIYCEAVAAFLGLGDAIKDEDEALRLLFQAKVLNFPAAYTALAWYYRMHAPCVSDEDYYNRNRQAMDILKEGVVKGHGRCYIAMAHLFNGESNENAAKCWKKYFLSETFAKDDDERWTKDINELAIGDSGSSRVLHSLTYFIFLSWGSIKADDDIRNLLIPLREEILLIIQRQLDYSRNQTKGAVILPANLTDPQTDGEFIDLSLEIFDLNAKLLRTKSLVQFVVSRNQTGREYIDLNEKLFRFAQDYFGIQPPT
ncbi:MAG: GIY-YIG nuclease family protein [Verrucomicrobiota bacterium]|jgi:hypothetical protein